MKLMQESSLGSIWTHEPTPFLTPSPERFALAFSVPELLWENSQGGKEPKDVLFNW